MLTNNKPTIDTYQNKTIQGNNLNILQNPPNNNIATHITDTPYNYKPISQK